VRAADDLMCGPVADLMCGPVADLMCGPVADRPSPAKREIEDSNRNGGEDA